MDGPAINPFARKGPEHRAALARVKEFVRANFSGLGAKSFAVEDARAQFLGALEGLTAPEAKRHAIGEEFVRVQQRILESEHYLDGHWVLGQGTIYPDTIESEIGRAHV